EDLRPAQQDAWNEIADLWRRAFIAEAGVAVIDRQPKEGAALMSHSAEITIGDQVQRLLAAVVRMGAPADIGHQAGSVPQPLLVRRLGQVGGADEAIGPVEQFLGMTRRA